MFLSDLLDEKYVQVGVEARDWRDAVRKSFSPLVESGAVSEAYVADAVAGVEKYGPYYVVCPHVALPHARPESGARRMAMGACILSLPVSFGARENDPVRYLFPLSATEADGHLEVLARLVDLLSEERFPSSMDGAQAPVEVVEMIRDMERSL